MSVHPLCFEPHPVLRAPARRVEAFTEELQQLARDMIETMYAHQGVGLAAPQIGWDIQVFVANPSQRRGREVVVVNPVLERAEGRASIVEGCLSVPNTWEKVGRAARIRLQAQDLNGQPIVLDAEGLMAIVLQHEFDHLQGRLFLDRLSWIRRVWVALKRTFTRVAASQPA